MAIVLQLGLLGVLLPSHHGLSHLGHLAVQVVHRLWMIAEASGQHQLLEH